MISVESCDRETWSNDDTKIYICYYFTVFKKKKCSFGEHKRFLSKNIYVKNRFQTFEHLCVSCTSLTVGCVSFSSFVVLRS